MWFYLLIKANIQCNKDFMNSARKAFEYLLIFLAPK